MTEGRAKNIRFGDLVRASGRPEVVTLWTDPKKDRTFTEAVQVGRVLTVIQEPGSKHKDFGLVGFHEQPHASYLLFPRPIEKPAGSRVIGINYLLLEETEVRDPIAVRNHEIHERQEDFAGRRSTRVLKRKAQTEETSVPSKRAETRAPAQSTPRPQPSTPLRTFSFTVRRTATLENDVVVEAETQKAARERALTLVKIQPFDIRKASMLEKIIRSK